MKRLLFIATLLCSTLSAQDYRIEMLESPSGGFTEANFLHEASGALVGSANVSTPSGNSTQAAIGVGYGMASTLGTLGGKNSWAYASDTFGRVVGSSEINFNTPFPTRHAFFFESGQMQDLGTLGGENSEATGYAASKKIIVGTSDTVGALHAHGFSYNTISQQMADIGTLGGNLSGLLALSSNGTAVGYATDANHKRKAIYYDTLNDQLHDAGTLGGATAAFLGIHGDLAVGWSDLPGGSQSGTHAASYNIATQNWVDLGTLAGSTESAANATNANGEIVG